MDPDFWIKRWQDDNLGFHEEDGNKLLLRYIDEFGLADGACVFLPLCGKTGDVRNLRAKGYRVAGAELSEIAIKQLFDDLGITSEVSDAGALKLYQAPGIDMFVGDVFDLTADMLGPVDAIYDRAALVALPTDMRARYTKHLIEITEAARQMVISFDYIQADMDGPPFSVDEAEVTAHYEDAYDIQLKRRIDIPGGLKGIVKSDELVFFLESK